MSVWMWLIYWWAGLTMEEVFLVTWGSILLFGILAGVIAAVVIIRNERQGKK